MYRLALIFCILLFSTTSWAGWSESGQVTSVISHNGFHLIKTTINAGSCGGKEGYFYWKADDNDAPDMFALSLSAFIAGKKISVTFNEEAQECILTNYTNVTHLSITD